MTEPCPSIFVRVDDRLIHGQVVTTWVKALGTRSIWVVSDRAANEPIEVVLLKSSVPRHLALEAVTVAEFMRQETAQLPERAMVLLERIEDALVLCRHFPILREVNLGGLRYRPGKTGISRSVYVSPEEVGLLKELQNLSVSAWLQIVPSDAKVLAYDKLPKVTGG